ncbi:MAG: FKBP-type peptidyl-prolyl cis-trans isomerase [Thermodesulfobacteriota bacterium]|nr:FKBP-type peptidyl-prolyl cis-trans isomerase [Thermodesulfobacteriota bacterium]
MSQVKNGNTVKVHLTGRLENGEVFSKSKKDKPFEFTLGSGELIPGFEKGIVGMEVGQTKKITVMPEESFGRRHEELVFDLKKNDFPVTPVIGQRLQIRRRSGNLLKITIAGVDEDTVTLDANHPLAGNTLFIEIKLVEIA